MVTIKAPSKKPQGYLKFEQNLISHSRSGILPPKEPAQQQTFLPQPTKQYLDFTGSPVKNIKLNNHSSQENLLSVGKDSRAAKQLGRTQSMQVAFDKEDILQAS